MLSAERLSSTQSPQFFKKAHVLILKHLLCARKTILARGAGLGLAVSRALSVRVLQFLSSKTVASLREVAEGVGERTDLVGHCYNVIRL